MRLALAALICARCAPSLAHASDWTVSFNPPPLHPSVIMTEYKGKAYPVTAVAAEVPEINVDGKLVKLHENQTYEPKLAPGFGHGYITFKAQNSSSHLLTESYRLNGSNGTAIVPGGTISMSGEYEGTLFATEAHTDCYLAIVFFRDNDQGAPDLRSIALAFGNIGDLVAGQEKPVKLNCAYVVPGGGHYHFFPMVFSRGVEIRSDQSEIEAEFFHVQESAAHAELLTLYRQKFPNADHPATPYLRFPPLLPEDVDPRTLPATINARFSVVETGEVDSLEISQPLDPHVEQAIRRAIGGWLFLPRLKKGVPVRTLINVPLSFGAST